MSYQNRRRPIKGGKITVSAMNKLLNESYKSKNKTAANIDDRYILDNDLSTDKTKVYIDKNTGEAVIANRGTSDMSDIITDAKLLMGYKDKSRFGEARDVLNKVKSKYPNASIDVLGHSLAGAVAETLGDDPQVKNVITLNKAITPTHLINKTKNVGKQYDIRSSKDVVSMLQPFQKTENDIVIPSLSNNLYTEHKIDILDRLPQDLVIGTGLKGLNELETYLYNLIIKEYNNLMYL